MNMQPVALHDLVPDTMGAKGLVGVPVEIAIDAIRKSAIEFCQQSTIWEYKDGFNTQMNVGDYPLFMPQGSVLASMKWVACNGYILRPNTSGFIPQHGWMRSLNPDTFYTWQGNGFTFTMDGKNVVWITPVPVNSHCCDHVTYCAALKPSYDACELPRLLIDDWLDGITSGAAYRLFSMPKQDWSNQSLAMLNQREFSRWIARARLVKMQDNTQAPGIMVGSYF